MRGSWVWLALSVGFMAFASYGAIPLFNQVYPPGWLYQEVPHKKWLNMHDWALHASVLFAVKSGWARMQGAPKLAIDSVLAALWADFGHRICGVWWVDRSDWWLLVWVAATGAAWVFKHRKTLFK